MIQIEQTLLILALVPNLLVVLSLFALVAGADASAPGEATLPIREATGQRL